MDIFEEENKNENVENIIENSNDLVEKVNTEENVSLSEEPKWYVLHTITGYESIAKQNLELVIEKYNLQNRIFEIVIPVEEVIEEKKGKKVIVQNKLMPTYIFIKMIKALLKWISLYEMNNH